MHMGAGGSFTCTAINEQKALPYKDPQKEDWPAAQSYIYSIYVSSLYGPTDNYQLVAV